MAKRPTEQPDDAGEDKPKLKEMMRQARELIGTDDGTNAAIDITSSHVVDEASDSGILRRKLKKLLEQETDTTE